MVCSQGSGEWLFGMVALLLAKWNLKASANHLDPKLQGSSILLPFDGSTSFGDAEQVSDLNDDKQVNDLIEALILASSRRLKVKVIRDGEIQLLIDNVPYDFRIDFDPMTGFWFVDS
jgi:hypothetical protein